MLTTAELRFVLEDAGVCRVFTTAAQQMCGVRRQTTWM
jgi:hypothetical protein